MVWQPMILLERRIFKCNLTWEVKFHWESPLASLYLHCYSQSSSSVQKGRRNFLSQSTSLLWSAVLRFRLQLQKLCMEPSWKMILVDSLKIGRSNIPLSLCITFQSRERSHRFFWSAATSVHTTLKPTIQFPAKIVIMYTKCSHTSINPLTVVSSLTNSHMSLRDAWSPETTTMSVLNPKKQQMAYEESKKRNYFGISIVLTTFIILCITIVTSVYPW